MGSGMDENEGSLRELGRGWARKAVGRVVHFTLDRLLEIDAVLEEDEEFEDSWIDDLEIDAELEEPPVVLAPAKLPLDTRWKTNVDPSRLRTVSFIDFEGRNTFALSGKGSGVDLETMVLVTSGWPELPCKVLGVRALIMADATARGLVKDLHFECEGNPPNLLPIEGWAFLDSFTEGSEGLYDLPALSNYPVITENEADVDMVVTIGVWGRGQITGELALVVQVLDSEIAGRDLDLEIDNDVEPVSEESELPH